MFSLAKLCRITDDGVSFQSHLDGSAHFITPETAIEIQEALGADIIMAFDQCLALPADHDAIREAVSVRRCGPPAARPAAARLRCSARPGRIKPGAGSARDLVVALMVMRSADSPSAKATDMYRWR